MVVVLKATAKTHKRGLKDYILAKLSKRESSNFTERVLSTQLLRIELEKVSRLLIVRLRSLGDSILTLPLLQALHAWRPDLEIDVLIEAPFAAVFSTHPAVHRTMIIKGKNAGALWQRFLVIREIRQLRYDAVLNVHGGTTSQLFVLASGAPLRIGQDGHRRSWLYNARIPPSSRIWGRSALHTVEHQLSLLRWLEIPLPADIRCNLRVSDECRDRIRERLRNAGVTDSYAVMQPTATLFTKQWSAENFARLGDHLAQHCSLPVIFSSGPAESQVLLDIGNNARAQHRYWSDLTVSDLFALIAGCTLFVGNDSGPTHAAAALGKPVVAIWGSSNYHAWRPWGTDYELVRSDLECIPCPGYKCGVYGAPKCILEITLASVIAACQRILQRTNSNAVP